MGDLFGCSLVWYVDVFDISMCIEDFFVFDVELLLMSILGMFSFDGDVFVMMVLYFYVDVVVIDVWCMVFVGE